MCSRHTFFSRVVLYITKLYAQLKRAVSPCFFARLDELRENCDTTAVLGSLNPGRFSSLASRVRPFPSTFGSQKASSRTELSRFILSTRAGLRLFCLLARGYLNCAPVPFKRPFLSPQPFARRRGWTGSRKNAQPCTILRKDGLGIAEATKGAVWERTRRRKRKGNARKRRVTYSMIFAAAKGAEGRKDACIVYIRGKACNDGIDEEDKNWMYRLG